MTTLAREPGGDWSADGVLVRAFLGGDEAAFDELYRIHKAALLGYLTFKVRDYALAEDLLQETMLQIHRNLWKFDPCRPFAPWALKIASRYVIAEMKRRSHEVVTTEFEMESPEDAVRDFITRDEIEACLSMIPLRQRRALTMRYLDDMDPVAIAELLDVSRNALEQLFHRARKRLGKIIEQRNDGRWLPGFAPLAIRLRRVADAAMARLNAVAGTGLSMAGDVALGTALTVGGVAVASGALHAYEHSRPVPLVDHPAALSVAAPLTPTRTHAAPALVQPPAPPAPPRPGAAQYRGSAPRTVATTGDTTQPDAPAAGATDVIPADNTGPVPTASPSYAGPVGYSAGSPSTPQPTPSPATTDTGAQVTVTAPVTPENAPVQPSADAYANASVTAGDTQSQTKGGMVSKVTTPVDTVTAAPKIGVDPTQICPETGLLCQ